MPQRLGRARAPRRTRAAPRAAFVASARKHASRWSGSKPATASRSRQLAAAAVERVRGSAGGTGSRRRAEQRRRLAPDLRQALELDVEPRQRAEQAPGVRVQRLLEQRVDRRVLGDAGRVHDDDVVRDLGDDAEVVRDQDHGGPDSAWSSRIRSRICACVVTSSAVVGSSAISSVGLVDERHRDHHALAHAAGELVRVVVDRAARPAGCRPPAAPRAIASSRASRCVTSRCSRTASTSWLPIESTGFSDVIGSWKIIAISLPRRARRRRCEACRRFSPRKSACAPTRSSTAERHLRQVRAPIDRSRQRDALARAGLADDAERLALVDRNETPSTALTMPSSVLKYVAGRARRGAARHRQSSSRILGSIHA